jgi:2-haloacid dehalogenase
MKYKWLLFDADNTLFDYDRAEGTALGLTLKYFGHQCSEDCHLRYRQINAGLFAELEKGLLTSEALRVERFKRLFSEYGVDIVVDEFSRRYLSNLSRCSMLIPGALKTIQTLFEDHKLLIVTNGIADVQRPRFDYSPIKDYFVDILISEEIGAVKPSPTFFDLAFRRMDHPDKKEVLMIGDSLTADISGGREYGIDTCWYNPSKKQNDSGLDADYEIQRLGQLLDVVR